MVYNVNGKTFTDHPLMDEIVYNCKLILNEIVIKNDVLANDYEGYEDEYDQVETFMIINNGTMTFSLFPFNNEILTAFGYDKVQVKQILTNKENVPIWQRDQLLEFAIEYFMENYEEKNKYYRTLLGLPPYGTDEYNVYIDETYFPNGYERNVDFSKPIHEMDDTEISLLKATGKIDQILSEKRGSNYSYLRFIGDNKIDLYTARKAGKYDILYMPTVENLVASRFQELYNQNKEIYLKFTYSEAYVYASDYYEQMMIFMILSQTFNDMIVDVPEWYIRRDIFDIRSVQYFLESYGVAFFKEIPLKYQIRIVKNLNKLIKFKSSNKNFEDILEVFSLKNTSIFKYYLFKKRLRNPDGTYTDGPNEDDKFELEFVQAEINDSYDNYIKDLSYRTRYDDITYEDKYWDGKDTHEYIKQSHLERDFTIEGTKYMSVEYRISLSEYLFQLQYFVGLLFDSNIKMNDIRIYVPSIKSGVKFRLTDLFVFLYMLTLADASASTEIIRPSIREQYLIPLYSNQYPEEYYDWMKKQYPEFFVNYRDRIYGFNSDVNTTKISNIIRRRHSDKVFEKGYTLEELGVDSYIVPTTIKSIDQLISIYNNNKECYDNLRKIMEDDCDNRDQMKLLQFVFDNLFTKQYDFKFDEINNGEKLADTLDEILKDRDFVLYTVYNKILSENNMETRRDNIRAIMNDIVGTLEYYLSGEGLEYIFAFTSVASFSALIRYIYLIINFFKSYKVYFLDPYITYVADDKLENSAKGWDAIAEKRLRYWRDDREFHRDAMSVNSVFEMEDSVLNQTKEVLDIYGHFEPDPEDDYDYNGEYPSSADEGFKNAEGGVADETLNIPYIMLNAGKPQEGDKTLWDINGERALEMTSYNNLDGGIPLNEDDLRKDYYSEGFKYSIDGGGPSTNRFFTRSAVVRVEDRQIESTIKISQLSENLIEEREDGLYVKDIWTGYAEYSDFVTESKQVYEYFSEIYDIMYDNIIIASNEEALQQRIDLQIEKNLSDMRKVYSYITTIEAQEERLNAYTDAKIDKLYDAFGLFSPYSWENF